MEGARQSSKGGERKQKLEKERDARGREKKGGKKNPPPATASSSLQPHLNSRKKKKKKRKGEVPATLQPKKTSRKGNPEIGFFSSIEGKGKEGGCERNPSFKHAGKPPEIEEEEEHNRALALPPPA